MGFSYGSGVNDGFNSDLSFLWENGTENHSIPYTEVYIRVPSCWEGFCNGNGECADEEGPAECTCEPTSDGDNCELCADGFQDNDENGTCETACAVDTCTTPGEFCFDLDGPASCAAIVPDCAGHLALDDMATSGVYSVDPDGEGPNDPIDVYCDMVSDGGGYTFYKIDAGSAVRAPEAEAACAELGMQLFIPRSEAHLAVAYDVAVDPTFGPSGAWNYLNILGIYPNSNGAQCRNMAMNSDNASCNWRASDDGPFWVSDRTNIGEPNGDNNIVQSQAYWFDSGSYLVRHYNDITAGYASRYFMCDTASKAGP